MVETISECLTLVGGRFVPNFASNALRRVIERFFGKRAPKESGDRLEFNVRANVNHGIFNIAAMNMVGPFIGIFAMKLGASKLEVALLSSAPAAVSLLAMIPGAAFIDRKKRKKTITLLFMLGHRLFYLGMVLVPFFSGPYRVGIFVAIITLMNFPGAISNVAWQSFISKIIPPELRAEAFATRNKLMNIVGTVVTLLAGLLLDRMSFPLGYQVMFVGAFLVALVELSVFNRIREDVCESEPGQSDPKLRPTISGRLRELLSQKCFFRFTLASVLFYFAWQIAWPLFNWYQVKELGANNLWVSLLNLANTGGSLLGYGFWVRMSHRHGHLKTLFLATIGMFIVPAVYAFSHNLYMVTGFNLVVGAIFSGVNLALFNVLLEVVPEVRKTTYIAYYNTAITLSTIFAPLAGVGLLNFMNFQWAFIICALLRILGALSFLLIQRMGENDPCLSSN